MQLWNHQERTVGKIEKLRTSGEKRICVQGPTGSGKTITFLELTKREIENGGRVVIYTNRKTLRAQISGVFEDAGVDHGVRAAGVKPSLMRPVQVSSLQTERARTLGKDSRWDAHDATLVIVDEAHSNRQAMARKMLDIHLSAGATVLGFTATPVGIGSIYDSMVQMASLEELRGSGVLVPCDVYAPSEVDMEGVKVTAGEYNRRDSARRVREAIVFGEVIKTWRELNPESHPTVLFAPGVPESRWFAKQFSDQGHKAEHIDARTSQKKRAEVFKRWADGDIKVVCNFGILREGFDLKQCRHAILAQPTRRLSTFVQIAGRVLRKADGKERAVLQDHVGAYWQFGSPNDDRQWHLDDTDSSIARERKKEKKKDDGPHVCPQCGCVRYAIPGFYDRCPKCGYEGSFPQRIVRTVDGDLKKVGDHRVKVDHEAEENHKLFLKLMYQGKSLGWKVRKLMSIYRGFEDKWPRQVDLKSFPYPDKACGDWDRLVDDMWPTEGKYPWPQALGKKKRSRKNVKDGRR